MINSLSCFVEQMDNALIDDRRIHVDFSQSVSKLWSQYRRKDNQGTKGIQIIFDICFHEDKH